MSRRILLALACAPILASAAAAMGCLSEGGLAPTSSNAVTPDAGPVEEGDPTKNDAINDSTENITYLDDLSTHPGCTVDGIATRTAIDGKPAGYTPAVLPDFPCAAKEFAPAVDDESKAIIILVHGNSSTPRDWETNDDDPDKSVVKVANTLFADGYHIYSADFRSDKVAEDPNINSAKNMDHGWTAPILEALVRSVHAKYPTRKINMAGFSLGTTIVRDALRRMHHRGEKPFAYIGALHLVSGANHGVTGYGGPTGLCGDPKNPNNKSMRGYCVCQMGNRENYQPTPFLSILNGPDGAWETPCADGSTAFGQANVCGGNKVLYTTAVHRDLPDGTLEDEFVSQNSAALKGADNQSIPQDDTSGYFLNGIFPHHYGAIRSSEGVAVAKAALER